MLATVILARSGSSFVVQGRQTILQAALVAGIDLDYSCQQGTCGTCRALVLAGDVEMEVDPDNKPAIGPKARERGYRLLCISLPRSPVVEVDL